MSLHIEDLFKYLKCDPDSFYQFHRSLEQQYCQLPWPFTHRKIAVFNVERGGRGDLAAAAKVIGMMQRMEPSLRFDWIVLTEKIDPEPFARYFDPSTVKICNFYNEREKPSFEADFLLVGPSFAQEKKKAIVEKFKFTLKGPGFALREISASPELQHLHDLQTDYWLEELNGLTPPTEEFYTKIHTTLFPAEVEVTKPAFTMGLKKETGVFIDRERLEAPPSKGDYLSKLKDHFAIDDDHCSFNSGYAHEPHSWARFIDFVSVHEREKKNVVIVLNRHGYFTKFDREEFCKTILTSERLAFLKKWGYETIIVKDEEGTSTLQSDPGRKLTLILRESFHPEDMKLLQLASERLLATGDNTAIEAWAARCKLYIYENYGYCKRDFLKQQMDIAEKISPDLKMILELGAKMDLSEQEMEQAVQILQKPTLSNATLELCHTITKEYSIERALEGALKRTAWHYCLPDLQREEIDVMHPQFKETLVSFLRDPKKFYSTWNASPISDLPFGDLSLLAERIQRRIKAHISC